MGRIGIEPLSYAKAGRLPLGVSSQESLENPLTEGKQMNAERLACAPSGEMWHGIDWANVHRQVRRLQARIVKGIQESRHNKVKALQWLLTHSFSGKALAVRRVTTNRGKNTPGVDNVIWNTPEAKTNAIASMKRRGYSPLPLLRVFI